MIYFTALLLYRLVSACCCKPLLTDIINIIIIVYETDICRWCWIADEKKPLRFVQSWTETATAVAPRKG